MLLGRILYTLVMQLLESTDHAETGVAWLNDIVDIALVCSIVWVAEEIFVFLLLLCNDLSLSLWCLGCLELLAIKHLYSAA